MKSLHFVDTTLRDGQMSLWATGMSTGMMLPIVQDLDRAGFDAIEVFANGFEKKLARELGESLWDRLKLLRERVTQTPLRAIRSRYIAAFHISPRSLEKLWYERVAANGIRQIRTADPSNFVGGWREKVRDASQVGIETVINLVFSISPKHTDEYYSKKARAAAKLRPYRICFKDPGALLTPDRVKTLLPKVMKSIGHIPLEFHTHCTTGLGTLCSVEAIKLGVTCINTAIPPLAHSSSNPSIFSIARNCMALGYESAVDIELLKPIEAHFRNVALSEGLPIGCPQDYDEFHYVHQVPGGMISNLRHQLKNMGLSDKLEEVLKEITLVRADLGYPIMVTPYSQFVGVQATMNVVSGARYEVVSDEIIQYAIGYWGEEEASSVDANVKDKILSSHRAKELKSWRPPQYTLKEARRRFGSTGMSDDDLLLSYFAGREYVASLNKGGGINSDSNLVDIINDLSKNTRVRSLQVQRSGRSLILHGGSID